MGNGRSWDQAFLLSVVRSGSSSRQVSSRTAGGGESESRFGCGGRRGEKWRVACGADATSGGPRMRGAAVRNGRRRVAGEADHGFGGRRGLGPVGEFDLVEQGQRAGADRQRRRPLHAGVRLVVVGAHRHLHRRAVARAPTARAPRRATPASTCAWPRRRSSGGHSRPRAVRRRGRRSPRSFARRRPAAAARRARRPVAATVPHRAHRAGSGSNAPAPGRAASRCSGR